MGWVLRLSLSDRLSVWLLPTVYKKLRRPAGSTFTVIFRRGELMDERIPGIPRHAGRL